MVTDIWVIVVVGVTIMDGAGAIIVGGTNGYWMRPSQLAA
jgi:hypothetical protein